MKSIFRQSPLTGGVNNRYSPRRIGENQIAEGWNVDLLDPTCPALRPGFVRVPFGQSGVSTLAGAVSGAADFYVAASTRLFVVAIGGEQGGLFYSLGPDDPTAIRASVTKGPAGPKYPHAFDPGSICQLRQGNGLLWCVSNSSNVHVLSPDGTVTDCGNTNESPPNNAVDAAYFLERMWFLAGSDLYYSKLLPSDGDLQPVPNAFDRQLQKLGLSPAHGAVPKAIVPWRDEALIVFFEDHIEQVVVNSSNPLFSSRQIVDARLGTLSARTVLSVGDAIYFIDQYGHFREIGRTLEGTLRGVRPLPISEPIRNEFPGNVNMAAADRLWMVWQDDRIKVFYPSRGSTYCDRSVNLVLHRAYGSSEGGADTAFGGRWECPWVYGIPMGYGITSSIRNGTYELFVFDGDPASLSHRVWVENPTTWTDDGAYYQYRETSRMWFLQDLPEAVHYPREFWCEFNGDLGVQAEMQVRANEHLEFISVGIESVVDANADLPGTHFPINIDADFPLDIDDDFPLVFSAPRWTALRGEADEENDTTNIPVLASQFPPPASQLPLTGPGRVRPGRGCQYKLIGHGEGRSFCRLSVEFFVETTKPHTLETP